MASRGLQIRSFVLRNVRDHPQDLVSFAANHYKISRQAAGAHVRKLVADGSIVAEGKRNSRRYELALVRAETVELSLAGLQEDKVWTEHIHEGVSDLPENVLAMLQYGCTEMINNAIDHSDGSKLVVAIRRTQIDTEIDIHDNGIGIFRKIKNACELEDERHSVLELIKGKLTTDPENHTGEGIFFTSRIMNDFAILSGEVYFSHKFDQDDDWILQRDRPTIGTGVFMRMNNDDKRTVKEVVSRFAGEEEDYGFNKTIVPVTLVREGSDSLVSRSQAKRLLARVDRFATVVLDFAGVDQIGRAFADEIFRVFVGANRAVLVVPINTNEEVLNMITAVRSLSGKKTEAD